jgi:isocitrate dehydrogenase
MRFSSTLEQVTVDTVESGFMTKDLALLVGDQQGWLTTEGFLDKVAENVAAAMGGGASAVQVGGGTNAQLDM